MYQDLADYVCDYCSRSFTRKYNLQSHIENCHVNKSCYCEICHQKFGSPAGLQLHLSRGHNSQSTPFPECDLCGRVFTRKQNITSHMITVHLRGTQPSIRCKVCDKCFTTERNLKRHCNHLHGTIKFEYPTCDYCNRVYKGKDSLIAHIKAAHTKNLTLLQCDRCDKAYRRRQSLKRHVESSHGTREEFRCKMCPKVYTTNQNLRRHERTRHDSDHTVFKCKHCFIVVYGRKNFDTHIWLHRQDSNLKEYFCDSCNEAFGEALLRRHIKTEHTFQEFYSYCKRSLLKLVAGSIRSSFYNCEFCYKTFESVYELKDHMRLCHDKEYCHSTCNVCFNKFYSRESALEHKKICLPPDDVNACHHCDKLFTDITSLEFHTRIFHPQAQADSLSCVVDTSMDFGCYKCSHCDRVYYSDRSLKHHVKLKHTSEVEIECKLCGKICSNKYYLASHTKIVHSNEIWSKCDYCEKTFKSKRNIRRHIEYTHMGRKRYKCVECETLFKEKRSLRKHVRIKHPDSTAFPQCHICHKRFESAKSCKIHLKLLHSFNMNTHPCDLCSVSFGTVDALKIHLQTKHVAEDVIYKCDCCNLLFNGQQKFDQHNENCHAAVSEERTQPRCVICSKDFSSRKTLKRHIKTFHKDFDIDELTRFGWRYRSSIDCEECVKQLTDETNFNVYQEVKLERDAIIFECSTCLSTYNTFEYNIYRYKLLTIESKGKMILSDLCTAEMSDGETELAVGHIKIEPLDDED